MAKKNPDIQLEIPMFQPVPIAFHPDTVHLQKVTLCILCVLWSAENSDEVFTFSRLN